MKEGTVHFYAPEVLNQRYMILPKYCRKFINTVFLDFEPALLYGLEHYRKGFRVFRQRTYEWHEPQNIQVAKIENLEKFAKTEIGCHKCVFNLIDRSNSPCDRCIPDFKYFKWRILK